MFFFSSTFLILQKKNFLVKIIVKISALLLLFCISAALNAQKYYFHQIESGASYGFTVPHRKSLNYIIQNRFAAGSIAYSLKTDGSEPWHHEWRFPEVGVVYMMTGLSNINVFGFAQSVYGFFGVPVYETDKVMLKYRIGTGVAYLSDKFESRTNYYNIAIGTHINVHYHFSFVCDLKPWDFPLYLSTGIHFNHFSNAAFKKPNLGLNLISFNTSIKYMISEFEYSLPKKILPFMNSEYYMTIYYGVGSRQNSTYENINYIVHSLVADLSYKINYKRSFGIGTNLLFDPSLKTAIGIENYKGTHELFRLGFHLSSDIFLTENLVCIFQIGSYAYNKFKDNKKVLIYNRIGIRYIINDYFVANFMIRSHTSVADFAELGFGYRIKI